jgi:Zn-dependent protease with chaperone function
MNPSMTTAANSLPARNWSIVALSSVGMATVAVSYMLAIVVALGCLALPVLLFVIIPVLGASFIFARLLLGAFGLVAGLTILWSLIPRRRKVEVKGARIDLSRQPRLHAQIAEIAAALREPMPSEVYLVADANAFVMESSGPFGLNKRRILGLGLPLLQMLTVAQFRAVLAHEFAHYYAGDTRLTPWLYNTQSTMERVYENLGRKSQVLRFLTRWAVVAAPYMGLMGACVSTGRPSCASPGPSRAARNFAPTNSLVTSPVRKLSSKALKASASAMPRSTRIGARS